MIRQEPAPMRLFSVLLLLLWIQAPEKAWAEEIPFTFENAEIQTIIKKAGELTGLAFLYDPEQVKGKITLHSPEKVAPQEALELLESALALHGYALLRKGNTVWIVPTERAPAGRPAHIEVVPLDYAEAGEVAYTLASLGPEGVRIVPYYPTNSLILYGDPQAVKALIWVIKGKGEAGQ